MTEGENSVLRDTGQIVLSFFVFVHKKNKTDRIGTPAGRSGTQDPHGGIRSLCATTGEQPWLLQMDIATGGTGGGQRTIDYGNETWGNLGYEP